MAGILRDKLLAEAALYESPIAQWTVLRCGWLRNGKENLDKVKFPDYQRAKVTSKVNREDVGAVALKVVEGGYGDEFWGKTVNIVSS
jgi:NAD(P)H-binding